MICGAKKNLKLLKGSLAITNLRSSTHAHDGELQYDKYVTRCITGYILPQCHERPDAESHSRTEKRWYSVSKEHIKQGR